MNEIEVRSSVELPSIREEISFKTADGLTLVGELATPQGKTAEATLLTLHPLPTHGGFMDSHVLRKAANRLPELANLAVLRFNTRGTTSPRGTSEGEFDGGKDERLDVEAALAWAYDRGLENIWLVGWSFGTELALKYGHDKRILGVILLSPPLHRTSDEELSRWVGSDKRVVAIVPEFDDYLVPDAAVQRFGVIPHAEIVGIEGAKHLWVGETATTAVLNEIVRVVAPKHWPLPATYRVSL
ncbi:MAG: alpha/beta hydrolase [Microbacteriaceae bacterium]